MTVTPWRARTSAMALPMPRPAPVTSAVRLLKDSIERETAKKTGSDAEGKGAFRSQRKACSPQRITAH